MLLRWYTQVPYMCIAKHRHCTYLIFDCHTLTLLHFDIVHPVYSILYSRTSINPLHSCDNFSSVVGIWIRITQIYFLYLNDSEIFVTYSRNPLRVYDVIQTERGFLIWSDILQTATCYTLAPSQTYCHVIATQPYVSTRSATVFFDITYLFWMMPSGNRKVIRNNENNSLATL